MIHHQKLVEGEEEEKEKKEDKGKRTSPLEHNKVTCAVHHDQALYKVKPFSSFVRSQYQSKGSHLAIRLKKELTSGFTLLALASCKLLVLSNSYHYRFSIVLCVL